MTELLGLLVANGQSRHYEAVRRGRVFTGMTAVTGVAPGTSIGTTAAFSLYNPLGSGVNLVVHEASIGYVSGTIGAGTVVWCGNTNPAAAATTGTAITAVNALLGDGYAARGKPLTTATLPATPTVMRPAFVLDAFTAATAVLFATHQRDVVDGAIVVTPGCTVSLEGVTAAGSSPLVVYGVTWEEVPLAA